MARDLDKMRDRIIQRYELNVGEYGQMRFDTYRPANDSQQYAWLRAKTVVKAWQQGNWAKGLMLASSDVGIGKTHLAIATVYEGLRIVPYNIEAPLLAIWPVPSLLDAIKSSYDNAPEDPRERMESTSSIMKRATQSTILLLDDLGVEHFNKSYWYEDIMYNIMNERWVKRLATIITTNLGPTQLENRLGKRVWSRTLSLVGTPVVMTGTDYRRNK